MSVEIINLKKSFSQGNHNLQILKGIHSKISKGEIVAIIGQSGSGKSTLLSILAGLDQADEGSIRIADADITKFDQQQMTQFRGKKIGIIFQQFHLISHLTALENVALPLEIAGYANALDKAKMILTQVGLQDRLNHIPAQLSGGECQRVAIARAIVTEPDVLLADEPSGNLDVQTGKQVMKILFDTARKHNITTLIVTHDEEVAKLCDRELKLKDGVLWPSA